MTREEFINRIDDIMCGTSNAERAYLEDLYYEVTKPHWISVHDELPPKDGRYLFYDEFLGPRVSVYYVECTLVKEITHWMPLPEAPLVTDLNKKDLPPVSWQEGNILVKRKEVKNDLRRS